MNEKRILIVDDEEIIRNTLKQAIEQCRKHYDITTAADGLAAYELLRHQSFELIITDFTMPGLNGLELAQTVRQHWPRVRLVLMSAHCPDLSDNLVQLLGFDAFVAKPFSLAEIFELTDRLLEQAPIKAAE